MRGVQVRAIGLNLFLRTTVLAFPTAIFVYLHKEYILDVAGFCIAHCTIDSMCTKYLWLQTLHLGEQDVQLAKQARTLEVENRTSTSMKRSWIEINIFYC